MKLGNVKLAGLAIAATLVFGVAPSARAQSADALLDLLIKKGVINQREANDVREQLDQQTAQTIEANSKLKLSSWVNSLQFYGDGRLRYEWRSGQGTASGSGKLDNADEDRFRYRLRFGVKGELTDKFTYGLRLETATKANSANVTMGGNALSGGPFAKSGNNAIEVGQFWAQYRANDYLTLIGGKMENPFMTTSLVWDGDISPEGAAEKLAYKTDKVDWFLTLGEFTYLNTKLQNTFGGSGSANEVWLLGAQAGGKLKINKDVSLTLAPTVYTYINAYSSQVGGGFAPAMTTNANNIVGLNNLNVFELPVEFAFPVGRYPGKMFGEFCVNLTGEQRAKTAGYLHNTDDVYAYQVGASLGQAKKKGDWLVKAWWQHTELFALDPNLVDSDLFDGRLNMQGEVVSGTYQITDFW